MLHSCYATATHHDTNSYIWFSPSMCLVLEFNTNDLEGDKVQNVVTVNFWSRFSDCEEHNLVILSAENIGLNK